jgi:hypothetical protein
MVPQTASLTSGGASLMRLGDSFTHVNESVVQVSESFGRVSASFMHFSGSFLSLIAPFRGERETWVRKRASGREVGVRTRTVGPIDVRSRPIFGGSRL